MKPTTLAQKFGVPQSLVDYISKSIEEETEYQSKVKAHMAKKGIKSLGDLTPDEKKKFFNDLDAAHKAKNEEVEQTDEAESHQSKTTMKHVSNPTAGEKKAAKDIKPGVKGYADRAAMLKSAQARGALKEEEVEQIDEIENKDLSHARNMYHKHLVAASRAVTGSAEQKQHYDKLNKYKKILGLGYGAMDYEKLKKIMKKEEVEQTDEAVVKGKGYDKPENERKGPEGKVPMTSLMPGHNDKAARLAAVQAKGKLVKGKAQSAPQKEDYELTQEDMDFINSLNEKK